jgi:cytochrome P450
VTAFSLGKRNCIGQALAEKELFVFLTSLVQQFRMTPAPGSILPSYIDIYPETSFVRSPPHFQIILDKRF